jgi:hypothetical protein
MGGPTTRLATGARPVKKMALFPLAITIHPLAYRARRGSCDVLGKFPRVRIACGSVSSVLQRFRMALLICGTASECVYQPKNKPGLKPGAVEALTRRVGMLKSKLSCAESHEK